jgi:translation initiation factor RLI1
MPMTRKIALVDYNRCRPEACDNGICATAQACKLKLLHQDAPYTAPLPDPFSCRTCGDCVRACPLKAIQLTAS